MALVAAVPSGAADSPTAARWVRRIATVLTAPMADRGMADTVGAAAAHRAPSRPAYDIVHSAGYSGQRLALDGAGLPVLLVGGLGSTPEGLAPLHDWLRRSGCRPVITSIRYGIDCGERTAERVATALHELAAETGRRCAIVAHSRGGQVARAVGVRHPDLVAGLVTLGSPLNRMLAIHPLLKAEVAALGLVGSLGVSGVLRGACLWGACCRRYRADLAAAWPDGVPFLSVFSRRDRLVDWRSSLDPAARHREVDASHSGLVTQPVSLAVLATELRVLAAASSGLAVAA